MARRDVKEVKALLDSGDVETCVARCKAIVASLGEGETGEAEDALYMVYGSAAVQVEEWEVAEGAFRRACELRPEAPQCWKGLLECLEGAGKHELTPEPLLRMACIAREKRNWPRCRSLLLNAARLILPDEAGEKNISADASVVAEQAILVLREYLDDPEAQATDNGGEDEVQAERSEILARFALLLPLSQSDAATNSASDSNVAGIVLSALRELRINKAAVATILVENLLAKLSQCSYESLADVASSPSEPQYPEDKVAMAFLDIMSEYGPTVVAPHTKNRLVEWIWGSREDSPVKREIEMALDDWVDTVHSEMLSSGVQIWRSWCHLVDENHLEAGQIFQSSSRRTATDWRYLAMKAALNPVSLCEVDAALEQVSQLKPPLNTVGSATHRIRHMLNLKKISMLGDAGEFDVAGSLLNRELRAETLKKNRAELLCAQGVLCAASDAADKALEIFGEAIKLCPDLPLPLEEAGWVQLHKIGDIHAAQRLLEGAVELGPSSRCYYRLARVYWELGGSKREERTECFSLLLKSARMNPSSASAADTFGLLGNWYAAIANDSARAEGCFSRALKLDASHKESCMALVGVFAARNEFERALECLQSAVEASPSAPWAWAGLAKYKLSLWASLANVAEEGGRKLRSEEEQTNAAVDHKRTLNLSSQLDQLLIEACDFTLQAISAGSSAKATDRALWEYWHQLGWIYRRQCKRAAALKAYLQSLEALSSTAEMLYGETTSRDAEEASIRSDIAAIQREMGQVDEAIEHLVEARRLALNLHHASSLQAFIFLGCAQTRLAQCHARTCEGLFSAAADALREGVNDAMTLVRLLSSSNGEGVGTAASELCISDVAWKLVGDLKAYSFHLPPGCLGGIRGVKEMLREAAEAFLNARREVKAQENGPCAMATAEYDLGLAHLLHSWVLQIELGDGSGLWLPAQYSNLPEIAGLRKVAAEHFKASLILDPTSSASWVGLGCCSSDPLVQQHCFVRAAQIDRNEASLVNLAALYCRYQKAHEAYDTLNVLQSTADHPHMWVILALLKESQGFPSNLRQVCDAFYSSLEASRPLDGLLGLGCTAPLVHSLQDGLSALEMYCDMNPSNFLAWNLHGLMLEHAGLEQRAAQCYVDSLRVLERQENVMGRSMESTKAREIVVSNLCRASALTKSKFPDYQMPSLLDGGTSSLSLTSKVLLCAGKSDWGAALSLLEKGGGDDAALLQGSLLHALCAYWANPKRGTFPSLFSGRISTLAAVSLLPGAPPLSTALIDRDASTTNVTAGELCAHYLALALSGQDYSTQRRLLCRALHLDPGNSLLWSRLSSACLRGENWGSLQSSKTAKTAARIALGLARDGVRDRHSQRGWALLRGIDGPICYNREPQQQISDGPSSEAECAALALTVNGITCIHDGDPRSSIRFFIKAVRIHPSGELFDLLALSLMGDSVLAKSTGDRTLSAAAAARLFRGRKRHSEALLSTILGNEVMGTETPDPLLRARYVASQGKPQEAIDGFKIAVPLVEDSTAVIYEMSGCLERLGKFAAAEAALNVGRSLTDSRAQPQVSFFFLLQLGRLHLKLGDSEKAMAAVNEAGSLELVRNVGGGFDQVTSFLRAAIWISSGKMKKAAGALDRCKDSKHVSKRLLDAYVKACSP